LYFGNDNFQQNSTTFFYPTIMVAKPSLPRSFRNWTIDVVNDFSPIKSIREHPELTSWLASTTTFTPEQRSNLLHHREILLAKIVTWSEEDLKMKFIAHVLAAADIDDNEIGYRTFFETTMKGSIDGQTLTARLDMVVAMGIAEPRRPFFFMQEYKRERGGDNDPLAQVLAAMLVAQTLNEQPQLLYGCYIIGRNWFFLVLDGEEYSVSDAYVATQDDIFQIVAILRGLKPRIEALLGEAASRR
jgi:hypothetical protein